MKQIVVVSCTNRPDSYTFRVSSAYVNLLQSLGIEAKLLDFRHLPLDEFFKEEYGKPSLKMVEIVEEFVRSQSRFIFVSPEYNGSFPGILKLFIDTVHPREWTNKHACLVGVSKGRAGNLRGMDHLTGVLNYLKMHVYHNKLPISVVDKMIGTEGDFLNDDQKKACLLQLQGFLAI